MNGLELSHIEFKHIEHINHLRTRMRRRADIQAEWAREQPCWARAHTCHLHVDTLIFVYKYHYFLLISKDARRAP
jgi:hypothetical protein